MAGMVIAKQQEEAGNASSKEIVGLILKDEVCWRGRFCCFSPLTRCLRRKRLKLRSWKSKQTQAVFLRCC